MKGTSVVDFFEQLGREDGAVAKEDGRSVETLTFSTMMACTGVHFKAIQREADERC